MFFMNTYLDFYDLIQVETDLPTFLITEIFEEEVELLNLNQIFHCLSFVHIIIMDYYDKTCSNYANEVHF